MFRWLNEKLHGSKLQRLPYTKMEMTMYKDMKDYRL